MLNFLFKSCLIFVFSITLFCSCGKQNEPVANQSSAPEMRIVSLAPSFTEILCDLGLQNSIVGVTDDSYYNFSEDVAVLGRFFPIDNEYESELRKFQCLTLKPTIIFSHDHMFTKKTSISLYPILFNLNVKITSLSDLLNYILLLSKIVNVSKAGEDLVESIQWDLLDMRLKLKTSLSKKFLILLNHEPLQVLGHKSFFSSTLELYGFASNMAPGAELMVNIDKMDFKILSPDFVIDLTDEQKLPDKLQQYFFESKITFVKGRVEWLIPSSRIVASVQEVVHILYPNKQ